MCMEQKVSFDYFYGTQADQYSFYRIPKALFQDEYFKNLSSDAKILYGLIMVMIYTVVLDKVLMMGARQMQVKIVSGQYERISALIQEKLDRGVTLLYIEGGHSGQPSKAVLTVVSPRELARLNSLVTEVDENAFMIISQVGEVHGRGFTLMKKYT